MKPDRTENSDTPGGQPQEKVEDRPGVSIVTPDYYPGSDRDDAAPADIGAGAESSRHRS